MIIFIVLIASTSVFGGVVDFNTSLPWAPQEAIVVDWKVKTTNTDGSNIRFNTATTGKCYVFARTRAYLSNSGQYVDFSPWIKLSTNTTTNHWLGAYVELNASTGDKLQLRIKTDVWNGDKVAGTWDYK